MQHRVAVFVVAQAVVNFGQNLDDSQEQIGFLRRRGVPLLALELVLEQIHILLDQLPIDLFEKVQSLLELFQIVETQSNVVQNSEELVIRAPHELGVLFEALIEQSFRLEEVLLFQMIDALVEGQKEVELVRLLRVWDSLQEGLPVFQEMDCLDQGQSQPRVGRGPKYRRRFDAEVHHFQDLLVTDECPFQKALVL